MLARTAFAVFGPICPPPRRSLARVGLHRVYRVGTFVAVLKDAVNNWDTDGGTVNGKPRAISIGFVSISVCEKICGADENADDC